MKTPLLWGFLLPFWDVKSALNYCFDIALKKAKNISTKAYFFVHKYTPVFAPTFRLFKG